MSEAEQYMNGSEHLEKIPTDHFSKFKGKWTWIIPKKIKPRKTVPWSRLDKP